MNRRTWIAAATTAVAALGAIANGVVPGAAPPPTLLAAPADEVKSVWPPTGPKWETDPEAAFARARAEDKGVLVYIATEACPHCKVMAREVWPTAPVVAAAKDVVLLAVYRWRKDEATTGTPKGGAAKEDTQDSEWAIRLDVKGYPQIRLLDGWGRALPSSGAHEMDRTAAQVAAGLAAVKSEGRKPTRPDRPDVPAKLLARLPEKDRAAAADPIGSVRCRTWLRAMEKGDWTTADLVALFLADDDAVLRIRILARLGATQVGPANGEGYDDAVVEVAAGAVDGPSDYVRGAALALLGKAGGKRAVKALGDTIGKAIDGRTGWNNPNNVLCEAVEATIATPDKALADPLGRVLATQAANNYATVLATRSLVAIGRKCGADVVRAHLERARKLEGPLAAQIRKEVEGFLGK